MEQATWVCKSYHQTVRNQDVEWKQQGSMAHQPVTIISVLQIKRPIIVKPPLGGEHLAIAVEQLSTHLCQERKRINDMGQQKEAKHLIPLVEVRIDFCGNGTASKNLLDTNDIKKLVDVLLHNNDIVWVRLLRLHANQLGDPGIQNLTPLLSRATFLPEELHLSYNNLSGAGASKILESLLSNFDRRQLRRSLPLWIRLEMNKLSDSEVEQIMKNYAGIICTASSSGCSPSRCVSDSTVLHLPHLLSQLLPPPIIELPLAKSVHAGSLPGFSQLCRAIHHRETCAEPDPLSTSTILTGVVQYFASLCNGILLLTIKNTQTVDSDCHCQTPDEPGIKSFDVVVQTSSIFSANEVVSLHEFLKVGQFLGARGKIREHGTENPNNTTGLNGHVFYLEAQQIDFLEIMDKVYLTFTIPVDKLTPPKHQVCNVQSSNVRLGRNLMTKSNKIWPKKQNRGAAVADFLLDIFGHQRLQQGSGVLDIAGGSGILAYQLSVVRGIPCTVVDPRPMKMKRMHEERYMYRFLAQRNLKEGERVSRLASCWLAERLPCLVPAQLQCIFDTNCFLGSKHMETFSRCSVLVGLHPDQATEAMLEAAVQHRKPFVIVPCCVFPSQFTARRLKSGKEVTSYKDLCCYIEDYVDQVQRAELAFEGRNLVYWWDPLATGAQ